MKKMYIQASVASTALALFLGAAALAAGASYKPNGWTLYKNSNYTFQVAVPPNEFIMDSLSNGMSDQDQIALGRLGGVTIVKSEAEISDVSPDLTISVYTNQAALEKDFSTNGSTRATSLADYMKMVGLKSITKVINGKKTTVYYGTHAIDGVGGTLYKYIATEVVGAHYAYMLQFYNSGNPNDRTIKKYLASFKAE